MLKIFKRKDYNEYLFSIYEEKIKDNYYQNEIAYYGLRYIKNEKRIILLNGHLLNRNEYVNQVPLYELAFNDNNIFKEIKKKIKRRIKFLNKKTSQILSQSDFLIIVLLQEIEKCEKELKEII